MCATDFFKTAAEWNLGGLIIPPADRWNFPMMEREIVGRSKDGDLRLQMASWGLVPFWAPDWKFGRNCFNARDDSLAQGKPAFKEAFQRRRCLLLGSAFVEWADRANRKEPLQFQMADGAPFGYAGLWETWGAAHRLSCTMVTTQPNELIAPVHSRMPVILDAGDYETWLDPDADRAELLGLLQPYPAEMMVLAGVAELPKRA